MRKHQKRPPRAVVICLVVALLLSTLCSILSLVGAHDPLRGALVTVSAPFTRLFDRVGGGIYNVLWGNRARFADWEEQKRAYELTIADQERQLAQLQTLQKENEQLRDYLGLREQRTDLLLCQAMLIYTADTSSRLIVLNKGSRDGIEVGMPVLDDYGLYGTVCEVSRTSCKVSTLLDPSVFVGVLDARSGVSGTLCGNENGDGECLLQYLDANISDEGLEVGDRIVTSGYGENYPAGLLVGHIIRVGTDPNSRAPYAYVDINADERYNRTSATLMIVTGEQSVKQELPSKEQELPSLDGVPAEDEDTATGGEEESEP